MTRTVTLNAGEMAHANVMAALRAAANASVIDTRRDTRRDPFVTELMGTVSELAFCKEFGAFPDLSVGARRGGHDAILKGQRWDIKAVDNPAHRLLATLGKSLADADRYALAVVTDNVVEFVGWAPAERLLHPSTVTDLGHGPTHALTRDQLYPFPEVES